MTCPSCSKEIPEGSSSCPDCGVVLETDPTVIYVPVSDPHVLSPEEASDLEGLDGFALVIEKGPRAGQTYILPHGSTTAGRHPDSDIFLDDVTVSRHHCRFILDDVLAVEDSGSTNGTYVNDARVDRSVLNPGDTVLVGRFHLVVAHGDG